MKRLAELKAMVERQGIAISQDQIHKLERMGIVFTTRTSKLGYRYLTDEQFKKSLRNILFYYFNTPVTMIKANGEGLAKRLKIIKRGVRTCQKYVATT